MADKTVHTPVLLEGVLAQIGELKGRKVVDGTFGGGGYTAAFLAAGAKVLAFDRDEVALVRGKFLQDKYPGQLTLVHASFADLESVLNKHGWDSVDAVVLDLGISSDQLDTPERGFGYQNDGPLDMRMGQDGATAADILNTASEHELVRIFREYGDEPKARPLAQTVLKERESGPITTTKEFLELIERVYPPRTGLNRRHPAQRIFQALRIAVNGELEAVEQVVPQAAQHICVGGRVLIVTFHSLEDRMVKRMFREYCQPELDHIGRQIADAPYKLPVRKVTPSEGEIAENPRARSATLRVLEKVAG